MRLSTRLVRTLWLIVGLSLVGCGGGGGSDNEAPPPAPSKNWDQMNWDQGEWA